MMRSMFSSVSGLRAHQTKMDVIGNNIANVNTVGFKASRVTFAEIFAQTVSGAGAPDPYTGRGGTNPMQIGLGMNVHSIDTLMTRGSLQRTDNPTDLAIEGEGFFIVRNGNSGTYMFTRAGNFTLDKAGNLVTAQGLNVMGWHNYDVDEEGNISFRTDEELEPLNIYQDAYKNKRILAAKSTDRAILAGNLDATCVPVNDSVLSYPDASDLEDVNPHFKVPLTVYDDLGNEYKLEISFWKNAVGKVNIDGVEKTVTTWYYTVTAADSDTKLNDGAHGLLMFDSTGKIVTNYTGTGDVNFSVRPTIEVTPGENVGADMFDFELNFEKLTMYATENSVKPTQVDGYPPGELEYFSIGTDGIITGIYSNGRQQPLGMIALAIFDNPAGLQKAGNNLFLPTTNSGDFTRAYKPGTEGAGSLNPGTLEMSNVDLAQQFTEMIITQRGFQANSRVITASDELLQELANMKR